MERCPECGRDYNDDSMSFCLDDGAELLFGPGSTSEPQTAILHTTDAPSEAATRAQIHTTAAEPQDDPARLTKKQSFSARQIVIAAVIGLVVLGGGYLGYRQLSVSRPISSIAVMPFVNDSGNADLDYLSDGMTEMLIGSPSQIAGLNVKA